MNIVVFNVYREMFRGAKLIEGGVVIFKGIVPFNAKICSQDAFYIKYRMSDFAK